MKPTNERILQIVQHISDQASPYAHHGDYTITVPNGQLIDVLTELKENAELKFNQLIDVTVVDWMRKGDRYEVVYILYSIDNGVHVRIKTPVNEHKPHIPTAVDIWESANWYEREAYDMYGVIFDGHPDLRRFYMPEDFMDEHGESLYPLRKDFPLGGIPGSLPLPPKTEIVRN